MAILRTLNLNAKGVSDLEIADDFQLFRDNKLTINVKINDYKKCIDPNTIDKDSKIIIEVENANKDIDREYIVTFDEMKISDNILEFSFIFSEDYSIETNMVEVQFRLSDKSGNSLTMGIIELSVKPGIHENNTERFYSYNDVQVIRRELEALIQENKNLIKNLESKTSGDKSDLINKINTEADNLDSKINNIKLELDGKINNSKLELTTKINDNKLLFIDKTVELDGKIKSLDNNLSDNIMELDDRMRSISSDVTNSRTEFDGKIKMLNDELEENTTEFNTRIENLNDKVDSIKYEIGNLINDERENLQNLINNNTKLIENIDKEIETLVGLNSSNFASAISNLETMVERNKEASDIAIGANKAELNKKIDTFESELNSKINNTKTELDSKINNTRNSMEINLFNKEIELKDLISDTETRNTMRILENSTSIYNDIKLRENTLNQSILDSKSLIDLNADAITKINENIDEISAEQIKHKDDILDLQETVNSYGSYKFIKLEVTAPGKVEIVDASDTRCKLVAQSIKDVKLQFPEKIESAVMTNISVYSRIFPTIKYIDKDSIIFRFYNSKEEIRTVLRPLADENGNVLVNELGIPLGYTEEEITIGVGTMELEYLPVGMTVHIIYLS